jgi:MoaA/NifB/PqqE/SkfB family radical SAM enzyme
MIVQNNKEKTPIDIWFKLVNSDLDKDVINKTFKELYRSFKPYSAGLVTTGICEYNCSHCIYHPDFSKYNKNISVDNWKVILKGLYEELGIRIFVHNGRAFNKDSIKIIEYIRETLPESKIGIIDNGLTLYPYIDQLKHVYPDWIDISIDGMEIEHDTQRNKKGVFTKAVNAILDIKKSKISSKLSVLTCLTSINVESILEMILFFNEKGIHNFFISPVSVLKNQRPSEALKVDKITFNRLIERIFKKLSDLNNVFIEISIFDPDYLTLLSEENKGRFNKFEWNYDHFLWKITSEENEFSVSYYPLSLDGIREFVVNCDGNIFLPKMMAKKNIGEHEKIGSLLTNKPGKLIHNFYKSESFNFYLDHFFEEKSYLCNIKEKL